MDLIPPENRETPWHYGIWDGKLSVAFGYAEHGWILMAIMPTSGKGSVVIQCSSVFDPFPDMQVWLEKIAARDFPADWEIDQEGSKTLLRANLDKDDQLDFQVWSYPDPEDPRYPPKFKLRARIARVQLLTEFHKRFTGYVREDFDPRNWFIGSEEDRDEEIMILDFRHIDLTKVEAEIQRMSNLGAEATSEPAPGATSSAPSG